MDMTKQFHDTILTLTDEQLALVRQFIFASPDEQERLMREVEAQVQKDKQ